MEDRSTPTSFQTPESKRKANLRIIQSSKQESRTPPLPRVPGDIALDERADPWESSGPPSGRRKMTRFNPLGELVKARLREFYREPGIMFWVFGFPLLMAMGLGIAFRSRPPERPVVGLVAAPANLGAEADARNAKLRAALAASDRVKVVELGKDDASQALSRAKVDVVVRLTDGEPAYTFDPTQEKSPTARLVVDDVLQTAAGRKNPLAPAVKAVSEPGSRYIDFLIPGLLGLNLMGSSMWGIGYNLVLARKRRLLRRYAVTPMRRSQFLLSYFFSRLSFLVIELSVLVTFGALVFQTTVSGSYLVLALVAALGAASFAGLSLLIGARIENTEAANGWMNLVQLPMWVLSGAFFSYERFPAFLHLPIELLPLTALVNALRTVYSEPTLTGLAFPVAVLVAWGAAGYAVALKGFRWQ